MKSSTLENDIINWICSRIQDSSFRNQCETISVECREKTGVDIYTYFSVSENVPKCKYERAPVDPYIDSPDLEAGRGCILFLKNGYIDMLEIFSYGDFFPKTLSTYVLRESERV